MMIAPPMPFVPEAAHGKPMIMGQMAYVGPADQAEGVLAPFRALAEPLADMLRPMRYPELYEGPEQQARSRPGRTSSPTRSRRRPRGSSSGCRSRPRR